MAANKITKETLDAILPIVLKDPKARPDFRLYLNGMGQIEAAKARVKWHAHRIINDREIALTRKERMLLLEFAAAHPPGPNAGKEEDPLIEMLSFRCSVKEKGAIVAHTENAKKRTGESRSDWLRRAALLLMRIEAGEIGIPGPTNPTVGD